MTLTHTIHGDYSICIVTVDYNPHSETAEVRNIEVHAPDNGTIQLPEDVIEAIGDRLMAEVDWAEVYADQNEEIIEEN